MTRAKAEAVVRAVVNLVWAARDEDETLDVEREALIVALTTLGTTETTAVGRLYHDRPVPPLVDPHR